MTEDGPHEEDKYGGSISELAPASVSEGGHVVAPKNNLLLVLPALVIFTASMEQTIIGTVLPVLASDLSANDLQYSWVGNAYLLAAVVILPVIGRATDIFGRKPALYLFLACFFVSSAICGTAKNMAWLICGRAFQGVGAGGMVSLTSMIVADVTPIENRALCQGIVNSAYTVAGAIAPVIGGALAERASWRWCFYISLPLSGLAAIAVALVIRLNPSQRVDLSEVARKFDFIGLALLTTGAGLITAAFSVSASAGYSSPAFIVMVAVGSVSLVLTVPNCLTTKRNPIVPRRAFTTPTVALYLFASLCSSTTLISSLFLLPQLFQGIRGSTPLQSGIELMPFSISVSGSGILSGYIMSRYRLVRPQIWLGLSLASLGYGLMFGLLRYPIPYVTQEILQCITAIGLGISLVGPLIEVQKAVPVTDIGAITGAFAICRAFGGNLGFGILLPVFQSGLRSRLEKIPGYGSVFDVPDGRAGYAQLQAIEDPDLRELVLSAFADAMSICWVIAMVFALAALLCVLATVFSSRRDRMKAQQC